MVLASSNRNSIGDPDGSHRRVPLGGRPITKLAIKIGNPVPYCSVGLEGNPMTVPAAIATTS